MSQNKQKGDLYFNEEKNKHVEKWTVMPESKFFFFCSKWLKAVRFICYFSQMRSSPLKQKKICHRLSMIAYMLNEKFNYFERLNWKDRYFRDIESLAGTNKRRCRFISTCAATLSGSQDVGHGFIAFHKDPCKNNSVSLLFNPSYYIE